MTQIRLQLGQWGRVAARQRLLCGALASLALFVALTLAACLADFFLHLPTLGRVAAAAAVLGTTLWYCWRRVVAPKLWRVLPEHVARQLEEACGIDHNALINALQLGETADMEAAAPQGLRKMAHDAGEALLAHLSAAPLSERPRLRRTVMVVVPCMALAALALLLWRDYAHVTLRRLFLPLADIPPATAIVVELRPAGTVTLLEGDTLAVEALVRPRRGGGGARQRIPPTPQLRFYSPESGTVPPKPLPMRHAAVEGGAWRYVQRLEAVPRSVTLRCWSGEACSRELRIAVKKLPQIVDGAFVVTPPPYSGAPPQTLPAPPAALEALVGSDITLRLRLDAAPDGLRWTCGHQATELVRAAAGNVWRGQMAAGMVAESGPYLIEALWQGRRRALASGYYAWQADAPPAARFVEEAAQRLVWPGETATFKVAALDDYGLAAVALVAQEVKSGATCFSREWLYGAAPGVAQAQESLRLEVASARFQPGESYELRVQATDFNAQTGVSERLIMRVRRTAAEPVADDTAQKGVTALQKAIEEQRRALGGSRTLEVHLDEAVQGGHLARHQAAIKKAQEAARAHGRRAMTELTALAAQEALSLRLHHVVELEMGLALGEVEAVGGMTLALLRGGVPRLAARQDYILAELIALQGRSAALARQSADAGKGAAPLPLASDEERLRELLETLEDFVRAQKRIVEQSRQLAERLPEDLSEEEQQVLGELAREEAKWAAFLKDKLNDLAKNPLQDFADGSLADEFNEVWQDVQKAAEELYAKKVELAVPLEQSGLESAEELVNNLERWLPDKPDYLKWLMEDPGTTPDAPLAELPGELEDIVGALLDAEEAMTEDVEDVTSGWIDSIDKGAGWDAMDGPISSMSAKGVTGNLLPNEQEIGGRSGEGRTGRSTGQMVESAAEGKDGRQTPSRLSDTPFESASIEDKAREDSGGATGGGKISGFGEKGLRGPSGTPRLEGMKRLAGKQAEIRQQAERLAPHLRARGLPAGDLGAAMEQMRRLEQAASSGDGGAIRQAFDASLERMRDARASVGASERTRREAAGLTRRQAEELWSGLRDDIPPGYEEIVGAYYRRVSEKGR